MVTPEEYASLVNAAMKTKRMKSMQYDIERHINNSDEMRALRDKVKKMKFARKLRTGEGIKGRYKPEVIEIVKKGSAAGKCNREIGMELKVAGFTECKSLTGLGTIVSNVIKSPEYQGVIKRQMEHISRELDDEKKYKDAPLKDLVNAQCALAKTFGDAGKGEPEDKKSGSYTINLIQFKK